MRQIKTNGINELEMNHVCLSEYNTTTTTNDNTDIHDIANHDKLMYTKGAAGCSQ